jgi:hypothetical protein
MFLSVLDENKKEKLMKLLFFEEPKPGLEPGTYSLRMNCSTN